jgi:hypothetical protein
MNLLRTSLLLSAVLIATSIRAEESSPATYDLKYKFRPGEVLRTEVVHRATVETTIQGTSQTAETRSTSVKVWKVSDIDKDGTVTFTHAVESIDMWQKAQGRQEVRYNSRTDTKPPQGYEDVAKQVGVVLTAISIDPRGKILKREEKTPQPNTNPTQITVQFPAEPVAVGHVWNQPFEIELKAASGEVKKIDTRQQFTLKSVSAGVATIELETQVLTPVTDPALEAQLVQRMTTGSLKFDIDAGRILSQQTDLDRRVIGFNGPASSMHYLTRMEEKLLSAVVGTAKKPSATKTAAKPPVAAPAKAVPKTAQKLAPKTNVKPKAKTK